MTGVQTCALPICPRALLFRAHCFTSLNTHFWVLCASYLFQSHEILESVRPGESPSFAPKTNKGPAFAAANVGPLLCRRCIVAFPAMRIGVSRYAEARLAQRHFGDKAAAVHECQREAELSATFGRLLPHQQTERGRVQRRFSLCF